MVVFDNVEQLVESDPTGELLAEFECQLVAWIAANSDVKVFVLTRIVLELETQLSRLAFDVVSVGLAELALTIAEIDSLGQEWGFPSSLMHASAIHKAADGLPGPVKQYFSSFDPLDAHQHNVFTRSNPLGAMGPLLAPQAIHGITGVDGATLPAIVSVIASTRRVDPRVIHDLIEKSEASSCPDVAAVEQCIAALELAGYLNGKMVAGSIEYEIPRPWVAALGYAFPSTSDAHKGVLRSCAMWCLDNGNAVDALLLAIRADDLDLAGEVTFRRSADIQSSDPTEWVQRILQQGMRRLSDHPLLLMQAALGNLKMRGYAGTDPGYFTLAARSARRAELLGVGRRGAIARAGLSVIEASAEYLGGSAEVALRAAHTSMEFINKLTPDHRLSISGALPTWLIQVGQIFLDSGQLANAEGCFRQASSVANGYMNLPAKFHSLCLLSLSLAHDGTINEASLMVAEIESAGWPADFFTSHMGEALSLSKALIHLERNELAEAKKHLTAVEIAESKAKYRYSIAVVAALLNHLLGALGQPLLPRQPRLDDNRQRPQEILSEISASRAFRAIMTGQAPLAVELLKNIELETDFVRLVGLRLALSQRDDQGFVQLLQPASHGIAQRWQLAACLLQAIFALKVDDQAAALALLRPTLRSLHDKNLGTPWMVLTCEEQDMAKNLVGTENLQMPEVPTFSWDEPAMLIESLTYRERHTLDKLVVFTSTKEIAAELFVSVNTAKTHLRSVYRKLGAANRNQALVRASALGLIGPAGSEE